MKTNEKILITGVGGAAGISLIKAFRPMHVELDVCDIDPHAAGLYLLPAAQRHIVPRGDAPEFVESLLELCVRQRIDVVIPTVDDELLPLARARSKFLSAGVDLLLAPEAALDVCLDKWSVIEAAMACVPVPKTRRMDETFDVRTIGFPLIVKPRRGSGSRGVRIVETAEEFARIEPSADLIAQEYLPGKEYSVDVALTATGRFLAAVPRERSRVDSGIAVAARSFHDGRLQSLAKRLSEHVGLTFAANIQFREDNEGVPRLLEINPRFPGTLPLTIESGVHIPRICLKALRRETIHQVECTFTPRVVVRYLTEQFVDPGEIEELTASRSLPDKGRLKGTSGGGEQPRIMDMHFHSLYSDGADSCEDNLTAAHDQGLTRVCCVDHVRRDTPWVKAMVSEVHGLRERYRGTIDVSVGLEAKFLNSSGELDLPPDYHLADFILAADHRFPLGHQCYAPEEIRAMLLAGQVTSEQLIASLTRAMIGAIERYPRLIIAHPFSILPKVGLSETDIPWDHIAAIGWSAIARQASIEISERWQCPSEEIARFFARQGVDLVASSDAHRKEDIGRFSYVERVFKSVRNSGGMRADRSIQGTQRADGEIDPRLPAVLSRIPTVFASR